MFLVSLFSRMVFNRSGFLFSNRYLLLLNWWFLFRCGNFFSSGLFGLFERFWLLISRVVLISSGFLFNYRLLFNSNLDDNLYSDFDRVVIDRSGCGVSRYMDRLSFLRAIGKSDGGHHQQ